jgi:hypothetical protein
MSDRESNKREKAGADNDISRFDLIRLVAKQLRYAYETGDPYNGADSKCTDQGLVPPDRIDGLNSPGNQSVGAAEDGKSGEKLVTRHGMPQYREGTTDQDAQDLQACHDASVRRCDTLKLGISRRPLL